MTKRTVLTADLRGDESKKTARKCIKEIEGVDSISINLNEKTITVDGDADPVRIAKNLGKKFKGTRLVFHGPPPPPPPPKAERSKGKEKKEEKKAEKKKEGKKSEEKLEPKMAPPTFEPLRIRDIGPKKQNCTIL